MSHEGIKRFSPQHHGFIGAKIQIENKITQKNKENLPIIEEKCSIFTNLRVRKRSRAFFSLFFHPSYNSEGI